MYPIIAAPANKIVDSVMQVKTTALNWLLFFREEYMLGNTPCPE